MPRNLLLKNRIAPIILVAASFTLAPGGAGVAVAGASLHVTQPGSLNVTQPGQQLPAGFEARNQFVGSVVSLEFRGGKAAEFIDVLRKAAAPVPVNVAFAGGADAVTIPGVSLKSVQLETAIRTAAELFDGGPDAKLVVTEVSPKAPMAMGGMPSGSPMFVLNLARRGGDAERGNRVLSLNDIIAPAGGREAAMPAETVLTAIETALRGNDTGVDIRFHKDSGLVFVSGADGQCRLAEEVVDRLRSDVRQRGGRSSKEVNEAFELAHTDPGTITDAVRTVFSANPGQPASVRVEANERGRVIVFAPENLMVGVRALVRYIDRPRSADPAVMEVRMAEEHARRAAVQAAADLQRAREMLVRHQDDATQQRAEAEVLRARAEEVARQKDMADATRQQSEEQAARLREALAARGAEATAAQLEQEALRRRLAEMEMEVQRLRQQLEKEAGKPK